MKQNCKGKIFQLTTSVCGEGTVGENNTNHVIKYFPWKTTGIGRGSGQVGSRWGGGLGAKKILDREFELVSQNKRF